MYHGALLYVCDDANGDFVALNANRKHALYRTDRSLGRYAYTLYNVCKASKRKPYHVEPTGRLDQEIACTCAQHSMANLRWELEVLPCISKMHHHRIEPPI